MKNIVLDREWTFRRGLLDSLGIMESDSGQIVNLPHDGMIGTAVSKDAPAGVDSGFFNGDVCNYTKYIDIPQKWQDCHIGLKFDGAMMHTAVDINGYKVGEHHYGYAPFYIDITDYVSFGEKNRITVNLNTGVQPSSRWYTGSGLFRGLTLCVSPKVHVANDGIYLYTGEVDSKLDVAFVEAQIDIANDTGENRLVEVCISLSEKDENQAEAKRTIQVNSKSVETARISFTLKNPKLWSAEEPNLYAVRVTAKDCGIYRTHFVENDTCSIDEATSLFGVKTVSADAIRGLRINGKTVKLKGGCLHHDNGLMGAVSLYECEARKIKKLKEVGFNAIRTTHNPPSAALVEACDRLGMYIFDEAFDAWGIAKRTGDYSQYFETQWEKDLTAFVKRDRTHPSVVIWSIGNEIPERGGLNNGYTLATRLADKVHSLDATRPVSNGICSFWSGLDDYMVQGLNQSQNAFDEKSPVTWEMGTEPFTNGLDIVGYNYLEDLYEHDHELFPERVILGSENFPKEIGYRWPMVEKLPYVIGDFTWTAWDYIGEAGIGKALYVEEGDPLIEKGPWALLPQGNSKYPWRTANDADFDITGRILPQGAYRSIVWGSPKTHLYSFAPDTFGKVEIVSMWGFPDVSKNWNYSEYEGKPIEVIAFSNADEVELIVNGEVVDRKAVSTEKPMPNAVRFSTIYHSGTIEAVSYKDGKKISTDSLVTSKKPAKICITPEKENIKADGHDVVFVNIDILDEDNLVVNDAEIKLEAKVNGAAVLTGFGTGRTITDENYTDTSTVSYKGHASAVLRSGYESGEVVLTITAEGLKEVSVNITVE